jgi:hypothetical protein
MWTLLELKILRRHVRTEDKCGMERKGRGRERESERETEREKNQKFKRRDKRRCS